MRITILNGDMNQEESEFSLYIHRLTKGLQEHHTVDVYSLNQMDLKYCTGCWACWWKTPGRCATKDDADKIFDSVIHSNFVIFASPLMAGFTSSALKKITDRFVVLLHPYIILKNGECHHKKRYDSYPDIGLLLGKEADTDDEDIAIVDDIYHRFAINFHCTKKYTRFIDQTTPKELIHETCDI